MLRSTTAAMKVVVVDGCVQAAVDGWK